MMGILKLIRFPGVFTALADVLAGFFILNLSGLNNERVAHLPHIMAASCCLYLCGMAWNDLFDAEADAKERPGRPIPSGKVSMSSAFTTAAVLSIAGVLLAMSSGMPSFLIGGLLLVMILLYDGIFKHVPLLGPLSMGCCRGLNILLGMSAHTYFASLLLHPLVIIPPILLTAYVTAITVMSSLEGDDTPPEELRRKAEGPEAPTEVEMHSEINLQDPLEGQRMCQINRKRELEIVLTQNKLDNAGKATPQIDIAPDQPFKSPALLWLAAACVILVPVASVFILPFNWPALGVVALLLLFMAKPAYEALRENTPGKICKLVGTSIVGICLLDAAMLLTSSLNPASRESLLIAGFIAIMVLPATVLRRYIALS